jgi:hypothetical protein
LDAALRSDPDVSNQATGFFQKNDLNAIFFLTDEGDTSMDSQAPATGRQDFFGMTTPCDAADPAQPSCYPGDINYRCLGVALKCDQLMTTDAQTGMTNCVERTTSVLKPSQAYAQDLTNFFENLGNPMMPDPNQLNHLFIRALWPLPQGYSNPNVLPAQINWEFIPSNIPPSNTLGPNAFCYDPASLMPPSTDPILGHPQVRLNNFVQYINSAVPNAMDPVQIGVGSICDANARANILGDLANAIVNTPMICPMVLAE